MLQGRGFANGKGVPTSPVRQVLLATKETSNMRGVGTNNDPDPRRTLKTLTSLNKGVRSFFLGDNSIWRFPSVSSLSDYSTWRS